MAGQAEDNFYIALSSNPIRFEPVSQVTNVFFDDTNLQVFAVRSGGAAGVVVKGADERKNITFRMDDKGEVISMKFSYDMKVLALQCSAKSVGKSTKIIGFVWTASNEIVFVTDFGIELYQVQLEKKSLKMLKSYSFGINWYSWLPGSAVLLLSTGTLGNVLLPFYFKPGSMMKLTKFEVDLPAIPRPPKLSLLQHDVSMAVIYGKLYVIVLRHQPKPGGAVGAEIALYHIPRDNATRKAHILKLDMSGRFAVNIVDNLVIVHHQASKTSMFFDIMLKGDTDGYVVTHQPVLSPLPIKPFKLKLQSVPTSSGVEVQEYTCEMFIDSPNWIAFQPNIIIDAKLGCMWYVQLRLSPLILMIPDKCLLVEFLLLRRDSKMVLLSVCKQILMPETQAKLTTISRVFNMLNKVYFNYLEAEVQAMAADHPNVLQTPVIDQSDMYTHVFSIYAERTDIPYKFMVSVLIEYIRSLSQFQVPVQACLLLSLESVYPPAHQLSLDMLKRLGTANEQIVEVLLSKQQLLPAIRFLRSAGMLDQISARKFLEAARLTGDKMIFYTVYKFFEQRNIRTRGSAKFSPGEHCEQYVRHYEHLYGSSGVTA
ncbi:hypothetical protein LSH36_16g11043 [Paralvinella palmiformis]|uniref:Mic1 domain-containing protein n=1 Tax=Paralvinella palmiformis TaxID=53620 RepID=A0AAD9KCA6_9ANNE|nr:hypothetical protein LSH36_16g11043 [Paralvinella palmiformis]